MFKKLVLAGAFATAMAMAEPASAGTIIGSTDDGNCYPFVCNEGAASFDFYQIYSAAAFVQSPMTFDTITFFSTNYPGAEILSGDYAISFGVTVDPIGSPYPIAAVFTSFFNGHLGGADLSITGASYDYDPTVGQNLVMHVVATGQDPVLNDGGLSAYLDADYTMHDVSRAYFYDGLDVAYADGALVTEFSLAAVPEPGAWALMLIGFGAMGGVLRTNRRRLALAA